MEQVAFSVLFGPYPEKRKVVSKNLDARKSVSIKQQLSLTADLCILVSSRMRYQDCLVLREAPFSPQPKNTWASWEELMSAWLMTKAAPVAAVHHLTHCMRADVALPRQMSGHHGAQAAAVHLHQLLT
jgi:hypothetical protein